jgi:hypothetical protein
MVPGPHPHRQSQARRYRLTSSSTLKSWRLMVGPGTYVVGGYWPAASPQALPFSRSSPLKMGATSHSTLNAKQRLQRCRGRLRPLLKAIRDSDNGSASASYAECQSFAAPLCLLRVTCLGNVILWLFPWPQQLTFSLGGQQRAQALPEQSELRHSPGGWALWSKVPH